MMKAWVSFKDGQIVETTAKRTKAGWLVGGDKVCAWSELGGSICVESKGKLYKLQGCRLVFQDNAGEAKE